MKTFFFPIFIILLLSAACAAPRVETAVERKFYHAPMAEKDRFQASQWLEVAQLSFSASDYQLSHEFCDRILLYYPETWYGLQAQEIKRKMSDPARNKTRDFIHNNPGLFLGE